MTETALPSLIQQMMQPEFYPHAVTETPIRLIQTHVSYVLLTGEYVYKLKKPVNFGFLDYSTLEKRHHFCQEEIRLNQRAAAKLYLEVLPITQSSDQFQFGGDGEPVEYAIKMVQFPQAALLTEVFDRGELTESLLERLAGAIADFHLSAPTSDEVRSYGEIPAIRQSIDENYDQTEQYIGGPQTQQQFDETKAYTDQFFAERAELFQQRQEQGWIRECHGDLHLRNICLWQDELYLFDCIEFNKPFRFVDVMFDIAYIVMDLHARDRADLSTVFLNAYVERTGDWEGLQVLPLYVSRQSYVRAKVTSFLLNDPSIPETEKAGIEQNAALYYRLAWQMAQPTQGQLFVMAGLSGSGKTTTARQLAKLAEAVHIRSDAVRKHLGGIPLNQRGGDDLYTPEMTEKTYGRLLELGITLVYQGYTVILDAKYDRVERRQQVIEQASGHEIPLKFIYCDAPVEVLRDRIQQRTGDIADATVDVLAKQHFESFTDAEQSYVTTIQTTADVASQLRALAES